MSTPRPSALRALAAAGAGLAALWVLGGVLGGSGTPSGPDDGGVAAVSFASPLGVPVEVDVPPGLVAEREGARVALRGADGAARVTISQAVAVVDPADGSVREVPDDPVGWLTSHPSVDVLSVRQFRGGGGWGTQGGSTWRGVDAVMVEYVLTPRSGLPAPVARLATVPLFCGPSGPDGDLACPRVGGGVLVRATFVQVADGGDPVLVEARWSRVAQGVRIPEDLRGAYRSVLNDVLRQSADVALRQRSQAAG